jgi:soluble lytic murein transglycosylase
VSVALFFVAPMLLMAVAVIARAGGVLEGPHRVEDRVLRYRGEAEAAAREAELDLDLLLAVCASESAGRADAVSHRGAVGLMQLMEGTALDVARSVGRPRTAIGGGEALVDLRDPATSLRLGALYLREQLDRFRGGPCAEELALAAYNAGPRRVNDWLRERPLDPSMTTLGDWVPFAETRAYLKRVSAWRRRWRETL